ncbi:MAG: type II toxin-antitoxin system PemK/MazF family toxin [Bryobacteraceae bacterium]|nr:type II toxin-antitoxin system PemK/MazF family toxin [Bryobacteraceae bacterium]
MIAAAPGDYGKPRPAVVVQNDLLNGRYPSVVLCPCTSETDLASDLRPLLQPSRQNGLKVPSRVMVDKVFSVAALKASPPVGLLNASEMESIDRALRIVLDLD